LTSHADPDSVSVSGTADDSPARINDLTVDLIPNPRHALSKLSGSDSEEEEVDNEEEPPSLISAQEAVKKVARSIDEVTERRDASQDELSMLKLVTFILFLAGFFIFIKKTKFASNVATAKPKNDMPTAQSMKETLDLYSVQRKNHTSIISACVIELADLEKMHDNAKKALELERRKLQRANRKRVEEREKKKAERAERRRERKEKKPDILAEVYRVRITIEVPTSEKSNASEEVFHGASLNLTYTTSSAGWTPIYDLRLDTINPALSTLTYRAHFTNRTRETWTDAQITLSTSQAAFGGLNEKIPRMESWRVTLAKAYSHGFEQHGANGLYSIAEKKKKEEEINAQAGYDVAAHERAKAAMDSRLDTGMHGAQITRKAATKSMSFFALGKGGSSAIPAQPSSLRLDTVAGFPSGVSGKEDHFDPTIEDAVRGLGEMKPLLSPHPRT
jgi:hypothetical protein